MECVHDNRTIKERIIDNVLLLHILDNYEIHKTKTQKAIFFIEDSMNAKKEKGFNYFFFRYHYGEFSRQLESDYNSFIRNGIINNNFETTVEGKRILKQISGILSKNKLFIEKINSIAQWVSENNLDKVKFHAYENITRLDKKVKDIPEGVSLLNKLEDSEANISFIIDDGWIETIDTMLHTTEANSLREAMKQKATILFEV